MNYISLVQNQHYHWLSKHYIQHSFHWLLRTMFFPRFKDFQILIKWMFWMKANHHWLKSLTFLDKNPSEFSYPVFFPFQKYFTSLIASFNPKLYTKVNVLSCLTVPCNLSWYLTVSNFWQIFWWLLLHLPYPNSRNVGKAELSAFDPFSLHWLPNISYEKVMRIWVFDHCTVNIIVRGHKSLVTKG